MNKDSKIYIAGHIGLVGKNLYKRLIKDGYNNILVKPSSVCDLTNQEKTNELFKINKPEYVFLCAAHVGGILENDLRSAEISYNNTMINTNVIHAAHEHKVKKLMFLGSSCIYPNTFRRKIKESDLLSDKLEETNIAYAVSKLNGIIQCQAYNKQYGDNFISVMPCNLYGPGDRYDSQRSHVLASFIMKIREAKQKNENIVIWGDGKAYREFIYIDDLIDAMMFLMNNYNSPEIINVGTGKDISIIDLARLICKIMDYDCEFIFDKSKPIGTYRKCLNIDKLTKLGWKAKTSLEDGIKLAIKDYTNE